MIKCFQEIVFKGIYMSDDFDNIMNQFDIPDDVMEKIQKNIEEIITSFPVPEDNKLDVIKKINFMYSHTRQLSLTDALTGLYNRRHFENTVEREFSRAERYGCDLTISIIDIDFFKKFNDTYGHLCGDYVLKEVAYIIADNFRKTDFVFRYGGEEFVVLLTETNLEQSQIPMERLRKTVENYKFTYDNQDIKLTISAGVACNKKQSVQEFLDSADKALYRAKESGRNKVVFEEN